MNNTLTVYQQDNTAIIWKLTPTVETSVKPYLEALNGKRVMDSTDNEIKAALSTGINKAVFNLGQQAKDIVELSAMINELLGEVKTFCKAFTLAEIVLACQNGAKEAYGQNYGINVAGVMRWMMGLLNDMKRQTAKKLLQDANTPKTEPKKELTDLERKVLAIEAFEKFKTCGRYDDWGNLIFFYLERIGLLNYSNERKAEIKKTVEKKELERLSAPISLEEKRKFEREAEGILNGTADLKAKCRREALVMYFSELIELGIELSDELNEI